MSRFPQERDFALQSRLSQLLSATLVCLTAHCNRCALWATAILIIFRTGPTPYKTHSPEGGFLQVAVSEAPVHTVFNPRSPLAALQIQHYDLSVQTGAGERVGDLQLIAKVARESTAKITCPTSRWRIENRFQRQSAFLRPLMPAPQPWRRLALLPRLRCALSASG